MGTDSTAARTLLDKADKLVIQTGNLLNWGCLKKKCPSTPSEELQDCIRTTLNEWSQKFSPELVKEIPQTLECTVPQAMETINLDEREEMKVSACSTLGVAQIDSMIIAPPPLEDGRSFSLENLQPYWEELESLVRNGKVVSIGTSDLDKALLEQLYLWSQVKPASNQVNLASCCIMPPDLTEFAKQFDIQLLTHNDPKELLSEEAFQEALKESAQECHSSAWSPIWILRYSVIVKTRGIIKLKGYILQAQRKGSL
uniref:GCS light chain n=1 Tax=Xenopus tropicalis TaxID=8364 RepID=A0A6I8RBJ6_XENTR